jgi:hypothetical protein
MARGAEADAAQLVSFASAFDEEALTIGIFHPLHAKSALQVRRQPTS